MKAMTFAYSIFCYAFFFGVFLYMIGFLNGFIVPKGINDGVEMENIPALLINVLLIAVFSIQHSVMARPSFKAWWTKIIGKAAERSTYVLFSSLALVLLFWQWQPMTTTIWDVQNESLRYVILGIHGLGWTILFLSTFMINHFDLFGLKQAYENMIGKRPAESAFTVRYFYQLVRHPLMLGFLIAFWATPTMTAGHLLFTSVCTFYIYVAVRFFEEKDLEAEFGADYKLYQAQIPMLIPFTKIRRKLKVRFSRGS
ncbi:MAG: methanethiol S-methyltransferase [Bacteroidota bacterium]